MGEKKRKALVATGHFVGDVADFLGMSEPERQLLDLRAAVSKAVRERRRALNMTQAELAALIQSTQPRVVKIEIGGGDVSLDMMFRALVAVGGGLGDLIAPIVPEARPKEGKPVALVRRYQVKDVNQNPFAEKATGEAAGYVVKKGALPKAPGRGPKKRARSKS